LIVLICNAHSAHRHAQAKTRSSRLPGQAGQ
jgi:hypothetical protein